MLQALSDRYPLVTAIKGFTHMAQAAVAEPVDIRSSLGNTVIVVEHSLDVVKTADYVIDLGLGGVEHGTAISALLASRFALTIGALLVFVF